MIIRWLKRAVLGTTRRLGYDVVKIPVDGLKGIPFVPAVSDSANDGTSDDQIHEAFIRGRLAHGDVSTELARRYFGSLLETASTDDALLRRAGNLLYEKYFSYPDKTDPDAIAIANLAILFFGRLIEQAPHTFEAYRRLWTLTFYLGDWREPYRIMGRLRESQRTVARRTGANELGLRFIPEAVAANIGVMTHIEMYIKAMVMGMTERAQLVMLLKDVRPANRCFLDCFKEYLRVVDSDDEAENYKKVADCLTDDIHWFIPFQGEAKPISWAAGEVRKRWSDQKRPPLLRLTDDHRARGAEALRRLGLPVGAWFVGLHVRDSRIPSDLYRDVNIASYSEAIDAIIERGGWVVRIGDEGMPPLPPRKGLIDYAHSAVRQDWIDIYSIAACRFFLGTGSGPSGIPNSFGVPNILSNFMPVSSIAASPTDLVMPKMCFLPKEGRILRFDELLSAPIADFYFQHEFDRRGIRTIDNTSDDLRETVIEMMDRLDGAISYSADDEELQRRFGALSARCSTATGTRIYSRVPRYFLRKYAEFL